MWKGFLVATAALAHGSPNTALIPTLPVDVLEVNHAYGKDGAVSYDQLIFWRWYAPDNTLHVVHYCGLPNGREPVTREDYLQRQRDFHDKWLQEHPGRKPPPYTPPWIGHKYCPRRSGRHWYAIVPLRGVLTRLVAPTCIETWTNGDPEQADRPEWAERDPLPNARVRQ